MLIKTFSMRKVIAFLLVLSLIATSLPFRALAEVIGTSKDYLLQEGPIISKSQPIPESVKEVSVISELTSQRQENIKHVRLSDGTSMALLYPVPVHCLKDNEWEEIDNTLVWSKDENRVMTKSSSLDIYLSKSSYTERLVSLNEISMSPLFYNGSTTLEIIQPKDIESKPVVKKAQKALSKVDTTYSLGINASGSPSAEGNVAIQGSFCGGFTKGSPSISITQYKIVTNAPNINKLEGIAYQIGGSIAAPFYGVPLAAGGDFNIIPDSELNKTYFGATSNFVFGTPGSEFHVEWGEPRHGTRLNLMSLML